MFTLRTSAKRLRLYRNESGTAALELGLMAPFLVLACLVTAELGLGVYEGMQVQNAAEAGAVYVSKYPSLDITGISNAVANSTGTPGITATPAPVQFCGCPTATGVTEMSSCATTCSDGSNPGQYIRINAQMTHQSVLQYTGVSVPVTLTGEAVVRLY